MQIKRLLLYLQQYGIVFAVSLLLYCFLFVLIRCYEEYH